MLFDAAGTLIALREPAGETYARSARRLGIRASAQRLDDALARSLRRAPPMLFPEASDAEAAARDAVFEELDPNSLDDEFVEELAIALS